MQGTLKRRAHAAIAGMLRGVSIVEQVMSEYRPRAAHGDPTREAASPRALIDGLGNYTSGLVEKPRISTLGDMTKAWNDHKLGVLTELPASSIGAAIMAIEAIVVAAQPTKGTLALS